jgi:SAM-dependent methyltransferase
MEEFWNKRFGQSDYAYGTAANVFFAQQLRKLRPGAILLPAEGEGRNAVHAARHGWTVEAFDISTSGREKALRLALDRGVNIQYQIGDPERLSWPEASFDAIALIFAHFPAHLRSRYHEQIASWLKPGGTLILEAFSKNHLPHSTRNPRAGGPKNPAMLFSTEEINRDFSDLEVDQLEEVEVVMQEGEYHVGLSSVVRFVGRKK